MVALSRNVSRKHAREMLLGGEFIDAQWAAAIGLINRSVPGSELAVAVDEMAQRIAGNAGFHGLGARHGLDIACCQPP